MSKSNGNKRYTKTTVTKTDPEIESFEDAYLEEGEEGNFVEVKVKKEVTKVTMMKVQSSSSLTPGSMVFNTQAEAQAYADALADPDSDLSQFLPKDSPENNLQIEEIVDDEVDNKDLKLSIEDYKHPGIKDTLKIAPTAPKEAFALDIDSDNMDTNASSPYESESPDKQFDSPNFEIEKIVTKELDDKDVNFKKELNSISKDISKDVKPDDLKQDLKSMPIDVNKSEEVVKPIEAGGNQADKILSELVDNKEKNLKPNSTVEKGDQIDKFLDKSMNNNVENSISNSSVENINQFDKNLVESIDNEESLKTNSAVDKVDQEDKTLDKSINDQREDIKSNSSVEKVNQVDKKLDKSIDDEGDKIKSSSTVEKVNQIDKNLNKSINNEEENLKTNSTVKKVDQFDKILDELIDNENNLKTNSVEKVENSANETENFNLKEVSTSSLGLIGVSQEGVPQNLESLNIASALPMDSPNFDSTELDQGTVLGVDISDLYSEDVLDSVGITLDSYEKAEPMVNIDLRSAKSIQPPNQMEMPPPLPPKDYWSKSSVVSPSSQRKSGLGAHPLSRDTTTQSSPTLSTNRLSLQSSSDPSLKRGKDLLNKSPHHLKTDLNAKTKAEPAQKETKGFMLKNLGAHDWTSIDFLADKNCGFFQDAHQRHLITRGINVGANTKIPVTPDSTYGHSNFYNHRDVSFVGRPFPLDEAPTHFARLKAWGLTFIRFLVPWEALEHTGPKEYDMDYIGYLRQVFVVAAEYGFKIVIDPHQDTWSRFSGGSGAPGWTFEVAGMDLTKFDVTGAAHLQGMDLIHPSHIPLWSTNYTKLATATMFTLFFGGNQFAPGRLYDEIPVQEYLQNHYIECYQHLIECLRGCVAVVGFETMNEPHSGYIGNEILTSFDQDVDLHLGIMPTPLESMALGEGYATKVAYYNKSWPWPSRASGFVELNKNGSRAWLEGVRCVWQEQGIWEIDYRTGQPKLLKPHYFSKYEDGKKVNFEQDFYLPFIKRMTYSLRVVNPDLILFLSPVPNHSPPKVTQGELTHFAYAPHWYDLKAIFNKAFDGRITHDVIALAKGSRNFFAHTYFGTNGARRCYSKQIKTVIEWGKPPHLYADAPVFIGELGIPMDINAKLAYANNDYALHDIFMDAVLNAVDSNFASVALWTYNPQNTHLEGDNWNFEDFSVMSLDQPVETDRKKELDNPLHRFGRCLNAVVRPYAAKVAGRPVHMSFDMATLEFHLEFRSPPLPSIQELRKMTAEQKRVRRQTEIFLPSYHYKRSQFLVDVSDGNYKYVEELNTLYYWYGDDRKVEPVLPTTDYEDDGMELSDQDEDSTDPHQAAFQYSQLDDETEEIGLDPNLVQNTQLHKVRVLLQEFVNDDW